MTSSGAILSGYVQGPIVDMKTKKEGIKELLRRLNELPAAKSMEAAYRMIENTLNDIESVRRGSS